MGPLKFWFKAKVGDKCRIMVSCCFNGFAAVMICIQVIIVKFYAYRKRNETLNNNQMFAVNYFNEYLSHRLSTTRELLANYKVRTEIKAF